VRRTRDVLESRARGHEEIPAIVRDLVGAQTRIIRQAARMHAADSTLAGTLALQASQYFYDTVAEVFSSEFPATVKLLRAHDTAAASWIDHLAAAWSVMSTDQLLAREMIDSYRAARGLSVPSPRNATVTHHTARMHKPGRL
jgi:hypothetical protein